MHVKKLDQDDEQMRSEGKRPPIWHQKQQCVCTHECVCLYSVCVWLHGMGNMRDVRLASVPLLAV